MSFTGQPGTPDAQPGFFWPAGVVASPAAVTAVDGVQFLLDDGSGTFPFDITTKVLLAPGFTFSRGRADWQGGVTAGELSLTLNNSDGRFTPGSLGPNLESNGSFETDISGWVTGGNSTLARSTAQAYDGAASMSITALAAGTAYAQQNAGTQASPCLANVSYTFSTRFRAATAARAVGYNVYWYDATGTLISGSAGGSATDTTTGWTAATFTMTSPAGAAFVLVQEFVAAAGGAGEIHYVDAVSIFLTTSPIKVDQRIRVIETVNGTAITRFTGYVKSWPVAWPATVPTFSTVQITATDAQARAERWPLQTIPAQDILAALPTAYFPLDDPSTSSGGHEATGNGYAPLSQTLPGLDNGAGTPSAGSAVAFGQLVDGITSAVLAGGLRLDQRNIPYSGVTPAFLIAFNTTSTYAGQKHLFSIPAPDQRISLFMTSGQVRLNNVNIAGGATFNDGNWHVVAIRCTGANFADIYMDGVLVNAGFATLLGSTPVLQGLYVGGSNGTTETFDGALAHMAYWSSAPVAAQIIASSSAILNQFSGEPGTARITRIAGYANLSLGTLDTSLTNLPGVNEVDGSAWDALQQVADAEAGVLFFNGSGNLTFHNRNRPAAKTAPDLTLSATTLTSDPSPVHDDQQILNYIEATAAATGVAQVVRNTASETAHGRYSASVEYLVRTDQEALDRANWSVANFAEPTTRYGTLTFNLLGMAAVDVAALLIAAEINGWLRIVAMPGQNTGGTQVDVVVEGYSEQRSATVWTLACNVVSKSLTDCLILDDPVRGVLDAGNRLYV